jgi:hypothetical protein
MLRFLVTAFIPSSPILVTLMMEALQSSETSVLTRATCHNIPGDGILKVTYFEFDINIMPLTSSHLYTFLSGTNMAAMITGGSENSTA